MKKGLIFLIILAVVLFLFMLVRSSKEAYKMLPGGDQSIVATPQYGSWVKFAAPSGLFETFFPTVPQFTTDVTRDKIGLVERTNEIYVSETEDGTIYLISVVRYHNEEGGLPLSDEQMMSNVMYEMIDSKPENKLLGFKKNKVLNRSGLEFTIVNENIQVDTQVLTNKNDLYILSYVSNLSSYDDRNFDHFVKSFKIKD